MHRSARHPITIVVAIVAALAVSLGLLAVPASADPEPPEPTFGLVELGVTLTGTIPGEEPAPYEILLEGSGASWNVIDGEAGTLEVDPTFDHASFNAFLSGLGWVDVGFQPEAIGVATGSFDPVTGAVDLDLDVRLTLDEVRIYLPDGDRYATLTECFIDVEMALAGVVEDATGVFTFGADPVAVYYDTEAAPCYLDGNPEDSVAGVIELLVAGSTATGAFDMFTSGPSVPTDVEAFGGPLSAVVQWNHPVHSGGLPVEGYLVEVVDSDLSVVVTSSKVQSVTVIGLEAGSSYQFQVSARTALGWSDPSEPTEAVEILPTTMEFSDVPTDHVYYPEITWLADEGITTGYEDGTFRPAGDLSRGAMAAFLYRMAGSPEVELPLEPTFSDVGEDNAFYAAIEWMWQHGLAGGYDDGTFRPTDGLSRQAMAAFLYRGAGWPAGDPYCEVQPFDDVPVDQAFCGEISWLASVDITSGYPDGNFRPDEDLSRQAMAAFLYRYLLVEPGIALGVG